MKKVLIAGFLGIFALGVVSCGHGTCDAYKKSDYSKYKSEKSKKVEVVSKKKEKK
ncbi:MAG: hypothetical protein MI810_15435 [Flavobacteriales bacterium]|nr:hypothetical protein [Flavobacteriales bacterium]